MFLPISTKRFGRYTSVAAVCYVGYSDRGLVDVMWTLLLLLCIIPSEF